MSAQQTFVINYYQGQEWGKVNEKLAMGTKFKKVSKELAIKRS